MELRLLETDNERNMYRTGMTEARATKGGKFRDNPRARASEIQLTFARLYGVFDERDPDVCSAASVFIVSMNSAKAFPSRTLATCRPGAYTKPASSGRCLTKPLSPSAKAL